METTYLVKAVVGNLLLALATTVKRNLFGMSNDARVREPKVTLQLLLLGRVFAKGRRESTQGYAREQKVANHENWGLAADRFAKLVGKEEYVDERLGNIRVEVTEVL